MSIQKRQLINNETGAAFVPIGHTEATYDANGNTVEQRLTHETQDREAADIDLQRDVAELQDTTARVGDGYEPDLSVTDASGNSIVQFQNGHIRTKNFDSEDAQETLDNVQERVEELDGLEDDVEELKETAPKIGENRIDFAITDESGNAIVEFGDGHIKTKNFNSADALKTKEKMEDLTIEDESGNVLAEFSRGHIKTKYFDSGNLSIKKKLRILAIGSSFAYDAYSYVPSLLEDIADVEVTFGILYYPGCKLSEHYDFLLNDKYYIDQNNKGYQNFSVYKSSVGYWKAQVMQAQPSKCIPTEDWDLVILLTSSDSFDVADPYTTNIQPYLQGIIDILMAGVGANHDGKLNNARFAWMIIPTPLRENAASPTMEAMDLRHSRMVTCAQNILRDTFIDLIIPCGTAVANARHTSLNNLGDTGYMTADGLHLQEGLPCLVDSYAATAKILDAIGHLGSIIGNKIRPTDAWIASKSVVGQNGASTGLTESNVILAQKCALWAVKKPFEITDNIEQSNT